MTEPLAPAAPGKVRIVLTGTLVAGALDITAAFVTAALGGAGPARVLASIASGLLGAGACDVGLPAAPLGMLLHFAIMLVICWVFVTAASRLPALIRQPLWSGPLYGVIVYLVMAVPGAAGVGVSVSGGIVARAHPAGYRHPRSLRRSADRADHPARSR